MTSFKTESWLTFEGCLTERLKEATMEAKLLVLSEQWKPTGWWAQFVLNLKSELCFEREIVVKSQNQPCWYAKTIIPETNYYQHPSIFSRLKNETLGDIIFSEPTIQRISLTPTPITKASLEYHWPLQAWLLGQNTTWMRHSVFTIEDKVSFYLIEIFLKGMFEIFSEEGQWS